ncbi:hypothetical protein D915_009768 [Fasciola hepatica]|uniref:Next to BRCA1 central domain-containing protein n=1 Tax=Fasciola hepatica TaxID=6192 RepID=A0A4E0QWG4_FASHE|nr:hypothetical protein D915_009768 [Fasciola hepatica]
MELGTCDVDAQLLEQFGALGTNDKDDLVNQLRTVVGPGISPDACRFFLELSGWNLQRAVGAYFDFSFEDSPSQNCVTTICSYNQTSIPIENPEVNATPPLFDVRIWPSPSGASDSTEFFKVTIENSGPTQWRDNFYIRSESNQSIAKLATRSPVSGQLAWLPIGADGRIPLPPVPPGQFTELTIKADFPNTVAAGLPLKPVVGGLSFCTSNGEAFGGELF